MTCFLGLWYSNHALICDTKIIAGLQFGKKNDGILKYQDFRGVKFLQIVYWLGCVKSMSNDLTNVFFALNFANSTCQVVEIEGK